MARVNDARFSDRETIPPIEIGSFIALRPDESEFIGSASGIFFTNTVFQAFAAAAPPNSAQPEDTADGPGPASSHSLFVAAENEAEQVNGDETYEEVSLASAARNNDNASHRPSYGLASSGLGSPPPPETAKELLMLYFRNWHPFFPFLHGPTFLDQVDSFYELTRDDARDGPDLDLRKKVCRAVTFQCIFNIAASGQEERHRLGPAFQIRSISSLTNLIGIMSGVNDIASLQALLAAGLYLSTRLSLRAASTMMGVLTQALYNSGLHRCPHRYIQLPSHMRVIRQRIFWCAYVLDRQLSQALGHPPAMKDDEIDVCYPGMTEMHSPVRPRHTGLEDQSSRSSTVREHLPRKPAQVSQPGDEPRSPLHRTVISDTLDFQSPASHHRSSAEDIGEYVLGYVATYSKLVNSAMNLFHQSIHSRSLTRETVSDLTSRVHSWWNGLPLALQQDGGQGSQSRFSSFFAVAYHYLIIVTSRPFLSLPTNRTDFKSNLQTSLTASRSIIHVYRSIQGTDMLMSWPGAFAAAWMSGLIVAFASLLGAYPLEKATLEITTCLKILVAMGSRWSSAQRCRVTLSAFLEKLEKGYRTRQKTSSSALTPALDQEIASETSQPYQTRPYSSTYEGTPQSKRQRTRDQAEPVAQWQPPNARDLATRMTPNLLDPYLWQPVLQYTGPDFGFDSNQLAAQGQAPGYVNENFQSESTGLYDTSGWDAYIESWGKHVSF